MNCFKKKRGRAAIWAVLLIILFTACKDEMDTGEIELGGRTFIIEIARTPEEREQGLMHRKELADDRGMLFVFEYDQKLNFWMKNTYIPLDIAYIAKDGTIKEICQMKPMSEKPVPSTYSVRYALEVNLGTFNTLGIEPGDVLSLPED